MKLNTLDIYSRHKYLAYGYLVKIKCRTHKLRLLLFKYALVLNLVYDIFKLFLSNRRLAVLVAHKL